MQLTDDESVVAPSQFSVASLPFVVGRVIRSTDQSVDQVAGAG